MGTFVTQISVFFTDPHSPWCSACGVALLYEQNYIRAKNAARRKALKRKLLEYNEDDARSLPFILDAVANLSPAVDELAEVASRKDHAGRDEADGRSCGSASLF